MTDFTRRVPRWTSRVKAEFLQLVYRATAKETRDLMEFHAISEEELASWARLNQLAGPSALRATYLQKHRPVIYSAGFKPRKWS